MPITPQPRTSDDQTTVLLNAFRQNAHVITRIELQRKGEKGGYHAFLDLNIDHGPEGSSPVTGDEQVESVMAAIKANVDEQGAAQHKVIAWGPIKKDGSEGQVFAATVGELPPTTEEGRKSRESNAIVETVVFLRGMLQDVHHQHVKLLEKTVDIPDTFRKVIESFPKNLSGNAEMFQYMAKKLDLDYADKESEREFRADEKKWEHAMRAIELVMPFVMGDSGIKGTPGKPPFVGKCHAFYQAITPEERQRIIVDLAPVGEDTLELFKAAGDAATDDESKARVRKIEQVWGGQDPVQLLFKLKPIIGVERGAVLIGILKFAGMGG